ncbi:hypothetical protein EJ04DRAFT_123004 [Polyplosphaeria fusca]|uniref:Uncharacterized protein n=1 Tax=Polyplosphaeria fusca TaxID=682080 RepID=A0A9P4QKD7_9PLEO|nr:hypothetical protein EJ04DRAFT_123004 [Polyplosphaeria fusca]
MSHLGPTRLDSRIGSRLAIITAGWEWVGIVTFFVSYRMAWWNTDYRRALGSGTHDFMGRS